ncbi:tetratricopeptide repeat protein [Aestuariicella hydrocarbonica]|uniref:Tetratricopeptide repeat protein n=1 Tax=Pseudomaricurvus hydrocarbonicus TaxID=1470433 RepID=A0A9E5JT61_9GAMM|nr:tetratricopeptide repeat protein [Aestuariicella hydrocarbonica]NHO65011.1 tetratricopeptide repeat protein [Aestuariicella hydrocarbonica]
MTRRLLSTMIFTALFLQGCATQLTAPANQTASDTATDPESAAEVKKPSRPFAPETLYSLLVAEMAGSRERYDIALGNYIQQAHKTRDPGVAARATRIARYLNARQAALNTSLLWVEISPDDLEAHFIAATELTRSGRLMEAVEHSNYLLQHHSTPIYQSIAAQASKATEPEREELRQSFLQLHEQYPQNTELLIGLGLLYQQQNELEKALEMAGKALDVDEELIPAVILETTILTQLQQPEKAIKRLAQLVNRHPENKRLRLQYARLLASTDLEKAQEQFTLLLEESPNDPELLYSLALICNERGLLDEAEEYFTELTTFERHRSSAHYYLGRIAEKRQLWDQALQNYILVGPGPDFMPAMLQTTDILVRGGQLKAAHKRLNAARDRFPSQAERFYLLEAEVLSRHLNLVDAKNVLTQGLNQFPGSSALLYSRAMVSEQLDMIDVLESDLRSIIQQDPNNATALNALGYTLADRTDRYSEAHDLISQALQLKPDDPAIIDSMGWVQYRLGNMKEALLRLREAMKAFPDHEIAAHLGEVLWMNGEHDEAEKVWAEGMRLEPSSRVIPAVMDRLKSSEASNTTP